MTTHTLILPRAEIILAPGEHYAGLVLDQEGKPSHHLILLPGDVEATWADAQEWAKTIGGELPTRREHALLFANLGRAFKGAFYWSGEQCSEGDAWGQGFSSGGYQDFLHKSFEASARAVRRLPA